MNQIESFFWGIVASLGAIIVEIVFFIAISSSMSLPANFSFSNLFFIPQFVIASVIIEESMKYLIIAKRVDDISLERTYLLNSWMVGVGFFFVELGLMLTNGSSIYDKSLIEIAIIHIGTAGILGYVVAIKNPSKIKTFFQAIFLTSLLHGAYNFLVIKRNFVFDYFIFTLLFIVIMMNIINLIRINKKLAQ
ncbi:MAG: hypothetical protein WCI36_03665 [bacterium]